MQSLVDGVDHVYVPMTDAPAAFTALAEELGLPVMWPYTSFGEFSSGGVSVGNIKLEVIEANTSAPWCLAHEPPQIQGVAFRPSAPVDDAYLTELDARSIPRTAAERFPDDGAPRWTNVYLLDQVGETAGAFVCDYHVPAPRDLELRRRVLEECDGGRLGVLDALELTISTPDMDAAAARWQRLLEPLPPVGRGVWQPRVGPAIRLVPGNDERVEHLVLAVRSEATAQAVWQQAYAGALRGFPLRLTRR